jgi:1,5-anhydro-D-fructose reductase (1,5-anhydro-D-mannitol-forming)
MTLRWGLIGASRIASQTMGPAIRAAGHELAAIYSRTPARAGELAAALDIPLATSTFHELWDADIDAVYISSTNDLHAEQTIAAARAGVHVLCEKPLAMSVADGRAMIDECRRQGVVLATNHHMRNLPASRAVRAMIADGALGRILSVRLMHASSLPPEWHGWRLTDPAVGGGIGLDLLVHDVDLLRYLLGADVEEVVGLTAAQGLANGAVEDAAMAVLRFTGDVLAFCHDAWTVPEAEPRLEIHGSEATVHVLRHTVPGATVEFVRRGKSLDVPPLPALDPYAETIAAFASAVRGDGAASCTGEDGLASVAAAIAATRGPARTSEMV